MTSSCFMALVLGIGTHAVGPLQDSSMKSLTGQFMLEKRHFWAENDHFPRFFGHFWPWPGRLG